MFMSSKTRKGVQSRPIIIISILLTLITFLLMNSHYRQNVIRYRISHPSNETLEKIQANIEGDIISVIDGGEQLTIQNLETGELIRLKSDQPELADSIRKGCMTYKFTVNLNERQFKSSHNANSFDYDKYLFSNGIQTQYRLISFEAVDDARKTLKSTLAWLRFILPESVSNPKIKAYFTALVLGNSELLDLISTYRTLGIAHVFAISGLHFGLLYKLMKKCIKGPDFLRVALIIILLGLYWELIGRSYSAERALLLIVYLESARLMNRKSDMLNGVAVINIVLLALTPYAVLSISYQLSFISYLAVAYFYKKTAVRFKTTNKIAEAIRFAIVLQLMLLPIQSYYFGEVNLVSFLANLIIVPLITIIFPFLFIAPFNFPLGISHVLSVIEKITAVLPMISFKGNLITPTQLIILTGIPIFLVAYDAIGKRFGKIKNVIIFTLIVVTLLVGIKPIGDRIIFFDVGHGDSAVIQSGNTGILIDTGDGYTDIDTLLLQHEIRKLDALILSHAHSDHIGGVDKILDSYGDVKIYCNEETKCALEKVCERPMDFYIVEKPITLAFGNISLNLTPFTAEGDPNNNAIAVETTGLFQGLFLGDLSVANIDTLLNSKYYDFVKVAHHGSLTGFSENLYRAHEIQYAIISNNHKYQMPNKDLLICLEKEHIPTYSTYYSGEMTLTKNNLSCFFSDLLLKPSESCYSK